MTSQYLNRIDAVRGKLDEWGVDALLIASDTNRRWLSGFTGTSGMLLVSKDIATLGTDSRYWERARIEAPDFSLDRLKGGMKETLQTFLSRDSIVKIGIEPEHVTLAQLALFKSVESVKYVEVEGAVNPMREVKTAEEIEHLKAAAELTDLAMSQVGDLAEPGMTESELAWKLEQIMREAGAEGMAFPIIVASGPNSALPHHTPGDRKLQHGEPLIVDMGARVNGYCGDLTRSFFTGDGPDDKFDEIYNIVLEAQVAAITGIKAGMMGNEADALARDIISEAGYGEEFGHSLGHGVGLDIHEGPGVSSLTVDHRLPDQSAVTIEPGIYIVGWGGVRIEDLVLVTASGCDYLSTCKKEPYIG